MSATLNVFNLGSLGVNTDRNPLQMEDGSLLKSQNASPGDEAGEGSLRKRPGLLKVNSVAAAGSITGAIGVPIGVGTAGNDGGFTPSPAVEPDTRLYLMGRRTGTTTSGWNTSTDGWTTSPTTGGPDGYAATAIPRVHDGFYTDMQESGDATHSKSAAFRTGRPSVLFENRLYYAGQDYTLGTTQPTIHMYDGDQDFVLARVPNRAGTIREAVLNMIVGGDNKIYFSTHDTGVLASNTLKSTIFQMDPDTGVIQQVGSFFPVSPETVRVPYDIAWYLGQLWTRTHGGGLSAINQLVYRIRPGIDTDWVLDATEASTPGNCNAILAFQGRLFMACPADASEAALIRVRSTQAAYSISLLAGLADASPSLVTFGYANHFGSMAVFGGNLYASYFNQRGTVGDNTGDRYVRVYKYDGTSWTVVYNPAANDASAMPYSQAVVIGGKLFFVSAPFRTNSNLQNALLYTSNGSSWTTVTTSILDDTATGILGAINQSA